MDPQYDDPHGSEGSAPRRSSERRIVILVITTLPPAALTMWYRRAMTKRNGKPCARCGGPRTANCQLCDNCRGTCARCGGPAAIRKSDGQYRTHCEPCRRIVDTRKTCSKCGKKRDGSHPSYCRLCYREYERAWAKANPERVRAKTRRMDLKKSYGMTVSTFNAMLMAQGGACAICRTTEPGGMGNFHVDHCHATGKNRALLCARCNVALGMAGDDPDRLRAMADYLERFRIAHQSSSHSRIPQ